MRSLLLSCLLAAGLSLGAGAALAQSGYGTFAPHRSPPPKAGGGSFAPLPGSEPYKPHPMPAAPKPPGVTDGGEGFKPFTGASVYAPAAPSYGAKPSKPKSVYDR